MVQFGMAATKVISTPWKRLIHWRKWSPGTPSASNQSSTLKSLSEKLNRSYRSPKSRQPLAIFASKSLASSQRLYTRPYLRWLIRICTSSMEWARSRTTFRGTGSLVPWVSVKTQVALGLTNLSTITPSGYYSRNLPKSRCCNNLVVKSHEVWTASARPPHAQTFKSAM